MQKPRIAVRQQSGSNMWPRLPAKNAAQALALQFQFQDSERWPVEKMTAHHMRQLQRLIRHAMATVPYYQSPDYQQAFAALTDAKGQAIRPDIFARVPLLQRRHIQENLPRLITTALPSDHGKMFPVKSSGSTGTPVEVRNSSVMQVYNMATTLRGHFWHGRDGRQKNLDIRGPWASDPPRPKKWMPVPDSGLSTSVDIAAPVSELLDHLIRLDPGYLQTRPGALLGLADLSLRQGRKPKSLLEARVYGETIDPRLRDTVRRAWGVEVKDNYSSLELGTIAIQCPETENLHVQSEQAYVEVLGDDGSPCAAGEIGRVVVTALHNYVTPLIRYDNGDYAMVGGPCSCGRKLPVLQQIMGRHRNLLHLPNGEKYFQSTGSDMIKQPFIRNFKMIQKSLSQIDVLLVAGGEVTQEMEKAVLTDLNTAFQHPFDFNLLYVDEIERPANAKFEVFTSEVED